MMGINTNTSALNTPFIAGNFDYPAMVLSDCVASMYGDHLHMPGRRNIARCPGWVVTNEQFFEKANTGARAFAQAVQLS